MGSKITITSDLYQFEGVIIGVEEIEMSAVALTDRWDRLFSESALVAVFRGSLLYRLTVGRAEFLALCLITLLMPFIPVTASAVLILAAGLLFLARGLWRRAPAWRDLLRLPLLRPMLLFLAVMLLLSVFSVTRRESLQITVLFGIYLAFYLMCLAEIKDKRKIYVLTVIFLVSVALEACFGLYQNFITRPPVDPSWIDSVAFPNITVRVFGTLDNPNILAQYLVPGIVLGLALALWKGIGCPPGCCSWVWRVSPGPPWSIPGRAWAGCRWAWPSPSSCCSTTGACCCWQRRGWSWRSVLRPDLLSTRLTSILNLSQDSSMYYRFQIWQVAARMIRDFWFSGVGPGSAAFQLVYNKFYAVYGMRAYHTHNLYIELLVEYGVFGTLIFLWSAGQLLSLRPEADCRPGSPRQAGLPGWRAWQLWRVWPATCSWASRRTAGSTSSWCSCSGS